MYLLQFHFHLANTWRSDIGTLLSADNHSDILFPPLTPPSPPSPPPLLLDPTRSLASFLRSDLGLTGTKIGCHEGGCGACTVLFTSPNDPKPVPINSCLKLLSSCNNCHILTTEGLGSTQTTLSDIQRAIADGNGSQCGFCTPGWVMACAGFLLSELPKTPANMEQFFDGNLCRCTGYRPIIQSFMKLLNGEKENCTGSCDTCTACDHNEGTHDCDAGGDAVCCQGGGESGGCCQDLEDLIVKKDTTKPSSLLRISDGLTEFFQPPDLTSALTLIGKYDKSDIGINAGHTGKGGVEVRMPKCHHFQLFWSNLDTTILN